MLGFSTMGITFIMGGYLMLGAVIFSGLEGGHVIVIIISVIVIITVNIAIITMIILFASSSS